MNILFYHPNLSEKRNNNKLTLFNLHNSNGFSGTENALIEISRILVLRGHTIYIIYDNIDNNYEEIDGIKHISINYFNNMDKKIIDWYSPLFYFMHPTNIHILSQLKTKTKILAWMHCMLKDEYVYIQYMRNLGFNIYIQCLSNYCVKFYERLKPMFNNLQDIWVINNGISPAMTITPKPIKEKKGNWVFHACFDRGGKEAINIFKAINIFNPEIATKFNIVSYNKENIENLNENIIYNGSLSKYKLFELLGKSDYFIYPLIQPDGNVHHDNYSTTILEAMSMGVIVITWDVAHLKESFGDYIICVKTPSYENYDPYSQFGINPLLSQKEALYSLIEAILILEMNPQEKEIRRTNGMKWARQQTWKTKALAMEEKLLQYTPQKY